jgi:FixJ family two-component response regulator
MGRTRVLVIDDDELITDSFRLVLEGEGYTVQTVPSASRALAAVDEAEWDCAFVDLLLPDMDGLELLEQLRGRRPGLPVVVITGHGSGLRGFASREAGAYAFLEKPGDMTPDKIVTVLASALARRRAEQELEAARHQVAMSEKLSTLGRLVSGVAHEIRIPLTYVTNNLYLVRQRLEQAARARPELRELVDEIDRYGKAALDGAARIDRLAEDLRRLARRDEAGPVEADLREVVGVAVDLPGDAALLSTSGPIPPVPVLPLDGSVQQVVLNLLTNAVRGDAWRHGPRVTRRHPAGEMRSRPGQGSTPTSRPALPPSSPRGPRTAGPSIQSGSSRPAAASGSRSAGARHHLLRFPSRRRPLRADGEMTRWSRTGGAGWSPAARRSPFRERKGRRSCGAARRAGSPPRRPRRRAPGRSRASRGKPIRSSTKLARPPRARCRRASGRARRAAREALVIVAGVGRAPPEHVILITSLT